MSSVATPAGDASALLQEALQESPAPVTLKVLEKRLKLSGEQLRSALATAARWPDQRKQQRFWHRTPEDLTRELILFAATECAQPAAGLVKAVKKRSHGYPPKLITGVVQQLVRDKELRKYSPFGRGGVLLGRAGCPAAYAAAGQLAIQAILAKVAAEHGALEDRILQTMARLEPAQTAPVSVRELRDALREAAKSEFDAAALALRERRRVFLSRHDFPQSLSQADRDQLIDGADGSYYVAITARTE